MSEVKNESRNPSLDGVRAIACISVFCVHFMQLLHLDDRTSSISIRRLLEYGFGVSAFIILSGAWIDRDRSDSERSIIGVLGYLCQKILRICPLYYMVLCSSALFSILLSSGISVLDFVFHALFVHNLSDKFLYSISPPFWYLGVQMQAYIVLALIAMWLPTGKGRRRARSLLLIFMAIACWVAYGSLIHIIGGNNHGSMLWFASNPMAVRHSVVAHLPNFLLAMAFSQQILGGDVIKCKYRIGNDVAMVLLLTAMAWIGLSADEKDITYWSGRYCFPVLTIPSIYLVSLCSSGVFISSILKLKFLVWLGRVSFPFYLVHYSILSVTLSVLAKINIGLIGLTRNTFVFLCAFGISMVLSFLLEKLNNWVHTHGLKVPNGFFVSKN
jgi:peptidoglycan/LPS O-acetylase OafA/YrhL